MGSIIRQFKSLSLLGFLSWIVVIFGFTWFGVLVSTHATTNNPDMGWTVRNGWMAIHHWQTTDSYTWTIAGKTRYDHSEWLSDVIYYLIYDIHGSLAIQIFIRIAYVALLGLAVWFSQRRSHNSFLSAALFGTIAYVWWTSMAMEARPQVFTYFFLVLYFYLRERKLWIWTILLPFWANLHGEYMVFIGLFFIDQIVSRKYRNLLWIPVWVVEVALLTPMHLFTVEFPFLTLFSADIKNYIVEWQSYPFHNDMSMVGFLVMVFYMYRTYKFTTWSTRVLMFVLFLLSMDAIRNLPLLGLFLIVNARFPEFKAVKVNKYIAVTAFSITLVGFVSLVPVGGLAGMSHPKAIAYIKEHDMANLRWYWPLPESTYLELHDPSIKLYWDGRSDMYTGLLGGKNFMRQLMEVRMSEAPITAMPDYSRIQAFFVYSGSALDNQLRLMPQWHRIYDYGRIHLYVKRQN